MFQMKCGSRWGPQRHGRALTMNASASSYTSAGDLVALLVLVGYMKSYFARKRVTANRCTVNPLFLKEASSSWWWRIDVALYTTWDIVTAIPCSRRAKIHCRSCSLMRWSRPSGPSHMALLLPREASNLGRFWYHRTNSSATDRVIPQPLKTVTLLQQLQLLADCIPPADIAGCTSRRPSNNGARPRHADERALWTNLSIRKRLGM